MYLIIKYIARIRREMGRKNKHIGCREFAAIMQYQLHVDHRVILLYDVDTRRGKYCGRLIKKRQVTLFLKYNLIRTTYYICIL